MFFFVSDPRPPKSSRTDTLVPYTTLFPSLAHLLLDLSDLNALGIGGHEEGADMGVLGEAFPRRSRHHQKQSGERRVGNETLRSAQQIVVAIAHGAGDESCAVRARTGFGETEAHDHLARRAARKIGSAHV